MRVVEQTALLYAGPVKRSMTIAGHTTSISLEPLFWRALEESAAEAGLPLSALVARIDAARIIVGDPPNLASAVRCWILAAALDGRQDHLPPSAANPQI